jgi:hypothetical protein
MQQLAQPGTSHAEPVKWLSNQDAQNALGVSRTTLHRRLKAGTYQSEKRNGRLFVAVPLEQPMEQAVFHDVPPDTSATPTGTSVDTAATPDDTSETSAGTTGTSASDTSGDAVLGVPTEADAHERDLLRAENAQLRQTLERADGEIDHLRLMNIQQGSAIQDLAQEIKGLTVALHREQERHALPTSSMDDPIEVRSEPSKPGLFTRLFARNKRPRHVRIGHA